jgi:hypothetical protein
VFVFTKGHTEWLNLVMTHTLGKDWQAYFDLALANMKMPLFQQAKGHFYTVDKT